VQGVPQSDERMPPGFDTWCTKMQPVDIMNY